MDSSNFGAASLQSVVARIDGDQVSPFRALAGRDGAEPNVRLVWALFCASLVLHVTIALRLQTNRTTHFVARKASQVEIQIARPPPPPKPVVVPPQEAHPPPPKLANLRPQPRIAPPEPVHAAPAAGADAPSIDAPPSDEGTAAPGTGEIAAPVVQVAAPPPPPPPPIVEAKEGANYLKNPRPAYPRLAQREGWQGAVLLRIRVLPNGHPGEITVQKSSGHGVLDDAATEVVKAWTFVPATQGGAAIAGWVNVPIEFRLQ